MVNDSIAASGDPSAAAGEPLPFTIAESARRIGRFAWIEARLFTAVGGWTGTVPETEATVELAAQARHHAWRAGQLWDRLATVGQWTTAEVVVGPGRAIEAVFDELEHGPTGDGADGAAVPTVVRLAGLHRVVLPALVEAYREHLARASVVCDAPVIRTLAMVIADAEADLARGDALLDRLVERAADLAAPALVPSRIAELEAPLAAAGGLLGTGTGSPVPA